MNTWKRKPPARRRKMLFTTTAVSQASAATPVFDATTSARVISGAILFLVALGALGLTTSEAFYIYSPTVTGNQRAQASEIVAASGIETLHVLWLQPDKVAGSLLTKMPELSAAFVWCGLPADCAIKVMERQPAFEWRQGQARTWVDVEGIAFPACGQTPDIPVIQVAPGVAAPLPGHKVEASLLDTMLALVKALPEIKSYRLTTERGIEFSDPKGNWPVYIGVGADAAERAAMWKALAASLASRNIRPTFVDVRYPSAPFYGK
jgi:cell division septal protein FtsQ